MTTGIAAILGGLDRGSDGIYSAAHPVATDQVDEVRLRESVAERVPVDMLAEVGRHHSIPVMDRELRLFLDIVPRDGVVVDVGGGWGWHWRAQPDGRTDFCVIMVDFVRANLRIAARLLGQLVNRQVFLVHGDATCLPFPADVFDGYWSVQALQHVPRFDVAVTEAHRVLRRGAAFASYSLNRARLIEAVYRIAGKTYHIEGSRPGSFYLARGSAEQAAVVGRIFGEPVTSRYTEVLFHPDLGMSTGAAPSVMGRLDARLSSRLPLLAPVARQRSYHTRKAS